MRATLEACLKKEAKKHIKRYFKSLRAAAADRDRYEKRTGKTAALPLHTTPRHWELDQQFNPFYVESHASSIAHALASKIRSGQYRPRPCLRLQVPKPSGGTRGISIFTVVDSAVSAWLFDHLLRRNSPGFSGYAYAYRRDRDDQHAIEHIATALGRKGRAYILEYDFAKYFDSIKHEYLKSSIDTYCKTSPRERQLIDAFLNYEYAEGYGAYTGKSFQTATVGFPQGATISLFFANMACFELDRAIERTGAAFARYADDTVILCDSYDAAHELACIMLDHGTKSGASINLVKSPGISLVADSTKAELRAKTEITFLGHEISTAGIGPSSRAVKRIKRKLSVIIYKHLLMHPKRGEINFKRVACKTDWDLVTCINELRRYLYGAVSEAHINGALAKKRPLRLTTCALSYFPQVKRPSLFVALDGWLADVLFRAYELRRAILAGFGVDFPHISKAALVDGRWYSELVPHEPELPSVVKSWRYTRKCARAYGVKIFSAPPPYNW